MRPAAAASPASLRPVPAVAEDIDPLFALIEEASRTTTVLPRTRDNLSEHLRDFLVIRGGGKILACGALGVFTRELAEIKSLVTAIETRGQGMGSRMVEALVAEARRLGIARVFALTDNPAFFTRMGFNLVDKATFPHKVWNECIRCPKFLNCREEAVELNLGGPIAINGGSKP